MVAAKAIKLAFAGKLVRWYFFSPDIVLADKPSLVRWQMLLTLVPDRCGGPSAHADAANRALSFPFVTARQLMFCLWRRPACLQPLSIGHQEHAADADGRTQ
jgi:hypothetical protein